VSIKVLIADDHEIVREGLKLILEAQDDIIVVGEAKNGREAVTLAHTLLPDVLLMDISMSELNGIEATNLLHTSLPSVRVIILSMHNTIEFIVRAKHAGAKSYLIKDSDGNEIRTAIRAVMKGRQFVGKKVEPLPVSSSLAREKAEQKSPLNSLSKRERETLQLVVEGNTNATIAELLNISHKSVETYRSRLMLKLGINNVPDLVKFALQHGVTTLS
jgi:DNA-binding NarL/FixJ family response regulator